ncbi:MAG: LuxR C-terminal-related transcriptional regulator [Nitrospirota bacterium]
MRMIEEFFENSADSVIGINQYQRICFWNRACERLFGLPPGQVRDKSCNDVVRGSDLNGDVFCRPDCPIFSKLRRRESAADHDLVIQGPTIAPVVVNVGTFVTPAAGRKRTDAIAFLVFRRVDAYCLIKRLAAEAKLPKNNAKPCKYQLTAREMEILELTAKGLKTPQLAAQLFISATTVRNHLKNIFSKLGVHSRAEAVGLALRSNFF